MCPGEADYIGRGVAFCAHCDGPFYAGKDVAVVGGGNSGIEAAIDLSGICRNVTVFEFLDELKADTVLIEKAKSLPNVEIHTSCAVKEISGDGTKVTGLIVENRQTGEIADYIEDGVFVQIGLTPNSGLFATHSTGHISRGDSCRRLSPHGHKRRVRRRRCHHCSLQADSHSHRRGMPRPRSPPSTTASAAGDTENIVAVSAC